MTTSLQWHRAIPFSQLDDEEPTQIRVDDKLIALCKLDDQAFAVDDICTHEYASLSDGIIEDGCLECPLHQALFDIRTGKALTLPAVIDLAVYSVKIEDGIVWVGV